MTERAIPRHTSAGMVILGHFWDNNDQDTYRWMRRFEDEQQRNEPYQRVYESIFWTEEMRPEIWRLAVKGSGRTISPTPTATSPIH